LKVTRLFFNTFYPDAAEAVLAELRRLCSEVVVSRSRVVDTLYYVELKGFDDPSRVVEVVRRVGGDKVFGVKAYVVEVGGSAG